MVPRDADDEHAPLRMIHDDDSRVPQPERPFESHPRSPIPLARRPAGTFEVALSFVRQHADPAGDRTKRADGAAQGKVGVVGERIELVRLAVGITRDVGETRVRAGGAVGRVEQGEPVRGIRAEALGEGDRIGREGELSTDEHDDVPASTVPRRQAAR
ncbi:hypothetical protein [Polyangium spumosum]|uniref:hypothetical protein n=1 Tax=Polyangium spumosum TaxID=889282 RepID=UPI0014792FC4|nr:hypothetical protein [Polyangium spumosum]